MLKAYTAILFLLAFPVLTFAQNQLVFQNITTKEGLSSNVVRDVVQDQYGFMWFATNKGLNRWDGHNMLVVRHDSTTQNSITCNDIHSLFIDSYNRFWVGTSNGLNLFNPTTLTARHFHYDSLNTQSIGGPIVRNIYEDNYGRIWLGTRSGQCTLTRLDTTNWTFVRYCHQPDDTTTINAFSTGRIIQDADDRYWVGTWLDKVGTDTFRIETNAFHTIPFKGRDKREGNLSPELINSMYRDSQDNIWFATYLGLYVYLQQEKRFVYYFEEFDGSANVEAVVKNEDGSLWLGVYGEGLYQFFPETRRLIYYQNSNSGKQLVSKLITNLYKDRQGGLWITTENGVSMLDPFSRQFSLLTFAPPNENLNIGTGSLLEDTQGVLWADVIQGVRYYGGTGAGYINYNPETNNSQHFKSSMYVNSISEIDGEIMIGTDNDLFRIGQEQHPLIHMENMLVKNLMPCPSDSSQLIVINQTNLLRLNMRTGSIKQLITPAVDGAEVFPLRTFSGKQDTCTNIAPLTRINDAIMDSQKGFWLILTEYLGVYKTLFRLPPGDSIVQLVAPTKEITTTSLFEDSRHRIWISSYQGLHCYNLEDESFISYTTSSTNNFPSDSIFTVMEDEDHFLWLFHASGISKFDSEKTTFEHFYTGNDLPVRQLTEGRANFHYGAITGKMYYGTMEGILAFTPQKVKTNTTPPPVFITRFETFGEPYPLDTTVFMKKHIELKHNENFFSFAFSALNYSNQHQNQYKYILENYSQNWIRTDKTEVNYTKVPPGNYVFKVRGSNNKGVWSEQVAQIHITVLPPWWLTWWAKTLWVLIPVVALLSLYFARVNALKRQQQYLESEVQKRTVEVEQQKEEILSQAEQLKQQNKKLLEVDEFKQHMTGMIVHDLKNPLNAILNAPENYMERVKQSGRQMLNMVLNILDVYKYEETQMTVDKTPTSLFELSHDAIQEVDFLAEQKGIDIKNKLETGICVQADAEIIKRVFVNILTNAIKYTPNNGKITISSETNAQNPNFVIVRITDTGQGIPKEQLPHVFDKFSQIEARKSGKVRSTGLGLTFCKMAVEAHSGQIGVESAVGQGATFWFTLEKTTTKFEEKTIQKEKTSDLPIEQQLTAAEKERIKPHLKKLKECKVYEITTIQNILKQIDDTGSPNIKKWQSEIQNCLFAMNEEKYKELVNYGL